MSLLPKLKTPEDFKKYNREVFKKVCGPELWEFLEEKEREQTNRSADNQADPGRA